MVEAKPISLSDHIKVAVDDNELLAISVTGDGYRFVSEKTRRRWEKQISARHKQLTEDKHRPKPKPKPKPKPNK